MEFKNLINKLRTPKKGQLESAESLFETFALRGSLVEFFRGIVQATKRTNDNTSNVLVV